MSAAAPRAANGISVAPYASAILRAIESANLGVCVSVLGEAAPRNVFANDAAVEILGHPREVLLSRSVFDFVDEEERKRLVANYPEVLAGKRHEPLERTIVVRSDGTRVPITYAVVETPVGDEPGRVSIFWSIAAQKEAEDAQRAEERRLRRLLESAPDGIVISRNGTVLEANPAAARMLGHPDPEALVGVSLHGLMSPSDTKAMIERVAASQSGMRLAARLYEARRPDGSTVTAEITSVPYEHDGKPAVLGFARDVTERLKLEAKLAQTERLAAVGTLAAGVAHEINNPLTVLSLGIQSLDLRVGQVLSRDRDGHSDEKQAIRTLLADLRTGVDRIDKIVRELRLFSRADEIPPGPTDLHEALDAAVRLAMPKMQNTSIVSHHGEVPAVIGDGTRLEQVFVNLLVNAAQAMPKDREGNRIDVRTYVGDDQRVVAEVSDNGKGMSPEVLGRAFEPFFTTKPTSEGTGLGLSLSYGILKRFGGELVIESLLGRGTKARVVLVPGSTEVPSRRAPESSGSKIHERLRILVVDDEPRLLATLRMLLSPEHDVTTVDGGERACTLLLDTRENFDVILSDVMMRGVSGLDLHARIAARRPELLNQIVFMTGGACTPVAAQFLETVENPVLHKPFHRGDLEKLIRKILNRNEANGHGRH